MTDSGVGLPAELPPSLRWAGPVHCLLSCCYACGELDRCRRGPWAG
jgi:hypothetical protein